MKQLTFLLMVILLGCGSPKKDNNNAKDSTKTNADALFLQQRDSIKPYNDSLATAKDSLMGNLSQDISVDFVPVPDYMEFEGNMDQRGKINLILYTDFSKGYGKYYYFSNPNVVIALKGYCGTGYDFADVELIEYEKTDHYDAISNNTPRAILKGLIKNDVFTGEWKDLKNYKILHFKLYRKNLKKELTYRKFYIETRIRDHVFINDFQTSLDSKCPPNTDTLFWTNTGNNFYLLLFVSHYSQCAAYDHGYCGAGMERFVIYKHLNPKSNLQLQQIIQFESCLTNNNGNIYVNDYPGDGNNDHMIKKLNFSDFKTLRLVFDSTTYTLNKDDMNSGFILSNKGWDN